MRYELLNNTHTYLFDSLAEAADEGCAVGTRYHSKNTMFNDASWIGRKFNNFDEVKLALNSLWTEGMAIYSGMIDELRSVNIAPPVNIRRQASWSEEGGDELNIDRLRSGQTYWRTTSRQHRPGPVNATIITDVSTYSHIDHDKIIWRGAAAVCLTELLEAAGYRVELWSVNTVRGGYEPHSNANHSSAICLKRSSDPLDASTLINAVSGWAYRTFYFSLFSLLSIPCNTGFGAPWDVTDALRQHITPDEQTVIAKALWSRESALSWVRTNVEKFQ